MEASIKGKTGFGKGGKGRKMPEWRLRRRGKGHAG